MSALQNRKNAELFYWVFIFFITAFWIVYSFYWPSAAIWRHTYQLPQASPGTLTSDIWTWEFFRVGLVTLFWLVPVTGLFMIYTRQKSTTVAHWLIALLILAWFVLVLVFDCIDLNRANLPPSDPNFSARNLANDLRYCGAYGGQPGTELLCYNNAAAWFPAIGAADLTYSGPFVFHFICNIILIAIIVFDISWTLFVYQPRLTKWLGEGGAIIQDLEKPLYARRKR